MFTIENDKLRVSVKKQGAELCSLIDKRDNIEHIWQADPTVWPWHAPMLFPIIGVSENDELRINGKKYTMQKHGFARKSEFKLYEQTSNSLTFLLKSINLSIEVFPFHFELFVFYILDNDKLIIKYEVKNTDTQTIYFSIGAHPAFALAYHEGESIEDYYLEFEEKEQISRHHINKADGMINGEKSQILDNAKIIPITKTMFEKDAYIFKDHISRSIAIKSNKHPKTVKVSFEDFNYLGLWAIAGAKYVCIEPWLGCADTSGELVDFSKKEGIISLENEKSFSCVHSIQIF
jgi:galactose mutarotase-like enzyme